MEDDRTELEKNRDWHQAKVFSAIHLLAFLGSVAAGAYFMGTLTGEIDAIDTRHQRAEAVSEQRFEEVDKRIDREIARQTANSTEIREAVIRMENKLDRWMESQIPTPRRGDNE